MEEGCWNKLLIVLWQLSMQKFSIPNIPLHLYIVNIFILENKNVFEIKCDTYLGMIKMC